MRGSWLALVSHRPDRPVGAVRFDTPLPLDDLARWPYTDQTMPSRKPTKARRAAATVRSAQYEYTVVFEPAEEGGFIVKVPALNGIATQGETLDEARSMAEDLIRGYLESLRKHGEPIPVENRHAMTTRVGVSLRRA